MDALFAHKVFLNRGASWELVKHLPVLSFDMFACRHVSVSDTTVSLFGNGGWNPIRAQGGRCTLMNEKFKISRKYTKIPKNVFLKNPWSVLLDIHAGILDIS